MATPVIANVVNHTLGRLLEPVRNYLPEVLGGNPPQAPVVVGGEMLALPVQDAALTKAAHRQVFAHVEGLLGGDVRPELRNKIHELVENGYTTSPERFDQLNRSAAVASWTRGIWTAMYVTAMGFSVAAAGGVAASACYTAKHDPAQSPEQRQAYAEQVGQILGAVFTLWAGVGTAAAATYAAENKLGPFHANQAGQFPSGLMQYLKQELPFFWFTAVHSVGEILQFKPQEFGLESSVYIGNFDFTWKRAGQAPVASALTFSTIAALQFDYAPTWVYNPKGEQAMKEVRSWMDGNCGPIFGAAAAIPGQIVSWGTDLLRRLPNMASYPFWRGAVTQAAFANMVALAPVAAVYAIANGMATQNAAAKLAGEEPPFTGDDVHAMRQIGNAFALIEGWILRRPIDKALTLMWDAVTKNRPVQQQLDGAVNLQRELQAEPHAQALTVGGAGAAPPHPGAGGAWAAIAGGNTPAADLENAAGNAAAALAAAAGVVYPAAVNNAAGMVPVLENLEVVQRSYLDAQAAYKAGDWAKAQAALTAMDNAATAMLANGAVAADATVNNFTTASNTLHATLGTADFGFNAAAAFRRNPGGLQNANAATQAEDVLISAQTAAANVMNGATQAAVKAHGANATLQAAMHNARVAEAAYAVLVANETAYRAAVAAGQPPQVALPTPQQYAAAAETLVQHLGEALSAAKSLLALPALAGHAPQQQALQRTLDYLESLVRGGDADPKVPARTLPQAELVRAARAIVNPAMAYPKTMACEMLQARLSIHDPKDKHFVKPKELLQIVAPLLTEGSAANAGAPAAKVIERILFETLDANQLIALSQEASKPDPARTQAETTALHNALLALIAQRIGTPEMRPPGVPQSGNASQRIDVLRPWFDRLDTLTPGNQRQIGELVRALINDNTVAAEQPKRDELYAWFNDARYVSSTLPLRPKMLPEVATEVLDPYAAGFAARNPVA